MDGSDELNKLYSVHLIKNDTIQEIYSIKIYLSTMTILEISCEPKISNTTK